MSFWGSTRVQDQCFVVVCQRVDLLSCRNPGVDLGTKRWDVDELSHSISPRKCNQVFFDT